MEIVEIPKDSIDEIEPLWRELNSHHHERSKNFDGHFSSLKRDFIYCKIKTHNKAN